MNRLAPALMPLLLLGCGDPARPPATEPAPRTAAEETALPVSILRPDVENPGAAPVEPARLVITFAQGAELGPEASEALGKLLESGAMQQGGPITIGGHSDAGGSDTVNQRISRERADAVRQWLLARGVAPERIRSIAFGEQNPLEPNALPDGSPNEQGRAANRRVEVLVALPQDTPAAPPAAAPPR